jgi:hypothetical protein
MSVTREIVPRDWPEFLHVFSDQNQGRAVRLESTGSPGGAPPLIAEHELLIGVEPDCKGSDAPAIMVMLGGMDGATPNLTHVITHPTHLWAEEGMGGLILALDIDSTDEGKTLLLFE